MLQDVDLLTPEPSVQKKPRRYQRRTVPAPLTKLSILILCYHEAATIADILDQVIDVPLYQGIEKEIIVVNECSTDDTHLIVIEYLEDNPGLPIRYTCHHSNWGKGAAIHTALSQATGDYMLIQDFRTLFCLLKYTLFVKKH